MRRGPLSLRIAWLWITGCFGLMAIIGGVLAALACLAMAVAVALLQHWAEDRA